MDDPAAIVFQSWVSVGTTFIAVFGLVATAVVMSRRIARTGYQKIHDDDDDLQPEASFVDVGDLPMAVLVSRELSQRAQIRRPARSAGYAALEEDGYRTLTLA